MPTLPSHTYFCFFSTKCTIFCPAERRFGGLGKGGNSRPSPNVCLTCWPAGRREAGPCRLVSRILIQRRTTAGVAWGSAGSTARRLGEPQRTKAVGRNASRPRQRSRRPSAARTVPALGSGATLGLPSDGRGTVPPSRTPRPVHAYEDNGELPELRRGSSCTGEPSPQAGRPRDVARPRPVTWPLPSLLQATPGGDSPLPAGRANPNIASDSRTL